MKAKKWVLVKYFEGLPNESDLELVEEELSELREGEVLFEAVSVGVDPYSRVLMMRCPLGTTMIGSQLSRVVQTKNVEYPLGSYYTALLGMRSHTVFDPNSPLDPMMAAMGMAPTKVFDPAPLPRSVFLGAFGATGLAAYFGMLKICDPKPGETVFVNAGAGAAGSIAGQIAKIKGCTVLGCAGSDEKVAWMKELGFDHTFNYKTCDLDDALKKAAPEGIDCYFDNVGGEFSTKVLLNHMKMMGRIAVCGSISTYNAHEVAKGPYFFLNMVEKQLKMEGFIVARWKEEYPLAIKEMFKWMQEGKLKHREHITEGFENVAKTFIGIFRGESLGRNIVTV